MKNQEKAININAEMTEITNKELNVENKRRDIFLNY